MFVLAVSSPSFEMYNPYIFTGESEKEVLWKCIEVLWEEFFKDYEDFEDYSEFLELKEYVYSKDLNLSKVWLKLENLCIYPTIVKC